MNPRYFRIYYAHSELNRNLKHNLKIGGGENWIYYANIPISFGNIETLKCLNLLRKYNEEVDLAFLCNGIDTFRIGY